MKGTTKYTQLENNLIEMGHWITCEQDNTLAAHGSRKSH